MAADVDHGHRQRHIVLWKAFHRVVQILGPDSLYPRRYNQRPTEFEHVFRRERNNQS